MVAPLTAPYMVSGFAFAFVLSLNEYIVAYMTVGFTMESLPVKIFNALRYGYANHVGRDDSFSYAGRSRIVGPDGAALAAAGPSEDTVIFADIDPDAFACSRDANTYLSDLRTTLNP